MKTLQIPLKDVNERTIYEECAGEFKDKTALRYLEDAVNASEVYEKYVPKNIGCYPKCDVEECNKEKIIKVYNEKFARRGSVGRKYYDAIMANANGQCPICGSGKAKNLDHFMPKSLYPILCVTPVNLIPVCRDCNFDKRDDFDTDYYSIPFNPYFDVMDDEWLACDISFYDDNTFDISYKNGYDRSQDDNKWKKYEKHFVVFDLNATFSSKAREEMENCRYYNKKLLDSCGVNGVLNSLIDNRTSINLIDCNSWKAALYRELVKKVDVYCGWLEKQ